MVYIGKLRVLARFRRTFSKFNFFSILFRKLFFTKFTKIMRKRPKNQFKPRFTADDCASKQAWHVKQVLTAISILFCQCFTHFAAKTSKIWLFHRYFNIKTPEKHSKNYLGCPVGAAVLIGIILIVFYGLYWESARFRTIFANIFQTKLFFLRFQENIFYQNQKKHLQSEKTTK